VDNQRNLADWQMREIAERGGVIGIYFIAYIRSGIGQPALNAHSDDLIRHIEHASDICGEDHAAWEPTAWFRLSSSMQMRSPRRESVTKNSFGKESPQPAKDQTYSIM
jgi:hypothetical protein